MNTYTDKTRGFTLIEFLLSSVALFLLAIIIFPLLQKLELSNQKAQILSNLTTIRLHADLYFEDTGTTSVSLYQLVGPKNPIPKLEPVAGETYPEIIYRNEALVVQTEKLGLIHLE